MHFYRDIAMWNSALFIRECNHTNVVSKYSLTPYAPVVCMHDPPPPPTGIASEQPGYSSVQVLFDCPHSVGEVQRLWHWDTYPGDISVG